MAAAGVRTTHRAISLHDSLFHSQFYSTSSHHLPHSYLRTYSYTLPLLRHLPTTSPLYTLPVICQKTFKLQIQMLKNIKILWIYIGCMVCKQFWVNSYMQTKLHFIISRSPFLWYSNFVYSLDPAAALTQYSQWFDPKNETKTWQK